MSVGAGYRGKRNNLSKDLDPLTWTNGTTYMRMLGKTAYITVTADQKFTVCFANIVIKIIIIVNSVIYAAFNVIFNAVWSASNCRQQ